MRNTVIARRYARALLNLASEQQALDTVRSEMRELHALLRASPELTWLLGRGPLGIETRSEHIRRLLAARVHPLTLRFLLFLNGRRRLALLDTVLTIFEELCDHQDGVVRVQITAAHTLSAAQLTALQGKLAAQLQRPMKTQVAVDAQLIGGFKLQIGDDVQDYSLATQLQLLKQSWLGANVN
ncbi:MAG: ATP synthase F1 subunit delta [Verrucomicrobia bacterium]|nr:MAG: ATP synthase F1 subunit delta [Verrucomicrobiota bacterium]